MLVNCSHKDDRITNCKDMIDGTGANGKCLFLEQCTADKGYLPTVINGCIILSGSFIRLALHVHFRIKV